MKAIQENCFIVLNGDVVAIIRRDVEKTKRTVVYLVEEATPEQIAKLINQNELSNNKSGDI